MTLRLHQHCLWA
ncbi:hypothetical protein WG66_005227 [Moniliophthora roreri]|nr:hypothetical protein WG66_005227 [Moniliophthora roreri]